MTVTSTEAAREEPGDVGTGATDDIGSRRWAVLTVLCMALLVIGIDGTIVNVALPSLVRELGASTSAAPDDAAQADGGDSGDTGDGDAGGAA